MIDIKVIKTEDEYNAFMEELDRLMNSESHEDMDRLELISLLIENYEDSHYPIPESDPVSYIESTMKRRGMRKSDLVKYMGSRSRVSEVMSRKRKLSLSMMRALHEGLGIPADILLSKTTAKPANTRKTRRPETKA